MFVFASIKNKLLISKAPMPGIIWQKLFLILKFKQMKKLNVSQMENVQGSGLSPKCLASMGLSGVAGGMIAGPWGYAIGAAGAYFWNPDC